MLKFQRSTLIDSPIEIVWGFHERPDILQLLISPWQPIEVVCREGGLEVDAISEFRIFLEPLPIKWVALHTEYEKNRVFTDEQTEEPFESWIQGHQFAEANGTTRLTDAIAFTMLGGDPVEFVCG